MTHPNEKLPDYALGLLDPDEVTAVEMHLKNCAACLAEVRRFDATLTGWVDALPELTPPPQVKANLFKQIRASQTSSAPLPVERPNRNSLEDVSAGADTEDTDFIQPDAETSAELGAETFIEPGATESSATGSSAKEPSADTFTEPDTEALPDIIYYRPLRTVRWLTAACAACLVLASSGLFRAYQAERVSDQLRAQQGLVTQFLSAADVRTATLYNGADEDIGTALLHVNEALFVLAEPPPDGRVYQAWGHTSDDWTPQSGEQLDSLNVSQASVFEVSTQGFASLYLSLEPPGGSPQPTDPLSRLPLSSIPAEGAIEVASPTDGATLTSDSVIVRGAVGDDVRELRYQLDGEQLTQAPLSGNRFTFTLSGLKQGGNQLELQATTVTGTISSQVLTLRFAPAQ